MLDTLVTDHPDDREAADLYARVVAAQAIGTRLFAMESGHRFQLSGASVDFDVPKSTVDYLERAWARLHDEPAVEGLQLAQVRMTVFSPPQAPLL